MLGLGLRGAGAVSSFGFAWLIARLLGAEVFGAYQIGFVTATLFATVALLGQDVIAVRQIAPMVNADDFAAAGAQFRAARRFVLRFAGAFSIGCAAAAVPLAHYVLKDAAIAPFIVTLAPMVFLLPLLRLNNALLRCLGDVRVSQSLEGVLYTTFAAAGLALIAGLSGPAGTPMVPLAVPGLLVVGVIIAWAIGDWLVRRHLARWPAPAAIAVVETQRGGWVAAGPIISQAGGWGILLAITALLGTAEAGIFRVALLTCMLMQLVNSSFATMAGPHLARAAQAGDQADLRRIVRTAGLIGVGLAAPVGIAALAVPEWVMGLFGAEFVSGAIALQLLAVGQLINVLAGPVGVALIMLGRERTVLVVEGIATLSGLGVAAALLPHWGLAGAGAGLLLTDLIRNGANWVFVQQANRRA